MSAKLTPEEALAAYHKWEQLQDVADAATEKAIRTTRQEIGEEISDIRKNYLNRAEQLQRLFELGDLLKQGLPIKGE